MTVIVVSTSHHVDEDESGSEGGFRYEYDLMTLRASSGLEVTVRTYTDTPQEVSLLRFALDGAAVGLGDVKRLYMDSVSAVAAFLRGQQFTSVTWLGGGSYVEVPE